MKKLLFFLSVSLFALQSCSINSESVYHADSASTMVMDVDMKDAMTMVKSMMPDSLKDKKEFGKLEKLPKTWTSLYDLEELEGKKKSKNPDSIRIMKKIFMKSNFQNDEMAGLSLKLDHFTKADYASAQNISKKQQLPLDQLNTNQWDGKTLVIDTEKFDMSNIESMITDKLPSDEAMGKASGMLKMMFKDIGMTLKFDKKIKSITGKHDWITKTDDHSVKIKYDLDYLFSEDKKPLQFSDKKIIIVTE
ncbi:hypothetical protein SAMN05443633_106120 [Chryseobacterium arachidis]|uniref:Lipoprotein n=1 Tax=Chryseobacterium arachidis TaxID=1416778 RepID=A0A1M5E6E5_9FLAO|nr:hypothetical protein [Chryseobacterium arachidis]SHF74823.1 hypothetical protein SAMN05443633_106120 [Chryseobacterium arachidis]